MSDMITIEVTKEDLSDMIIVADLSLFETIRNDPDVDNIAWVATRVKLIDKMMRANGEEGIMYHDKLCFIDAMVSKLHGNKDSDDVVMDAMKEYLEYEVKEHGYIPDQSDYLDVGFMEHCYNLGRRSMEMYSNQWNEKQRKHDDDKIMKVICRAVKAVMDYEWGKDGILQ